MTLGDWITLAAIAGVVIAVIWGRKRGRERMQAALSAAAEGGRAQAEAELTARLTNQVIVSAGNSSPSQDMADEVLLAALRRIANGQLAGDNVPDGIDYEHFRSLNDRAGVVRRVDRQLRADEQLARGNVGDRDSWPHPRLLDSGTEG